MTSNSPEQTARTIFLIAASRGPGLAIAEEFLKKGWNVVGIVRAASGRTKLHGLADRFKEGLEIETLDICEQSQVEALRQRLSGRALDILFVNAGTTIHDEMVTIGCVTTDEFVRVMVTNALCPMRVVESLQELFSANGPRRGACRLGPAAHHYLRHGPCPVKDRRPRNRNRPARQLGGVPMRRLRRGGRRPHRQRRPGDGHAVAAGAWHA